MDWRKIYKEQLYDLHPSRSIIGVIKPGRMRWTGYVARVGKRRGANSAVVVRPSGKSKLGSPKRRWEAATEMDLQYVRREYGVD
jgi:hypothetical protein